MKLLPSQPGRLEGPEFNSGNGVVIGGVLYNSKIIPLGILLCYSSLKISTTLSSQITKRQIINGSGGEKERTVLSVRQPVTSTL